MANEYSPPTADNGDFNFDTEGYTPKSPLDADFDFALSVYYVLAGTSNIFTSIWADPDASMTNGKIYVTSWGPGVALSVLDIATTSLYDAYTTTDGGRAQETLESTDTRDLNVNNL
jgi:hypothetical protein